jgi:hypothetical protein
VPNKANQFVLPILYLNSATKKDYFLYDTLFENCFITTIEKLPSIALLYRYSESVLFSNFDLYVKKHPLFNKTVEYDYYHIMYLFDVPLVHFKDIEMFKNGKYSLLSSTLKNKIMYFFNFSLDGDMAQILSKSSKRKRQLEIDLDVVISPFLDLYSIPDLTKEIYNYE